MEQCLEIADTLLRAIFLELLVNCAVIGRAAGGIEDTERGRHRWLEIREHKGERLIGLVVDDEIFFGHAVAQSHDFGALTVHPNTLVGILAEDERFAVAQNQLMIGLDLLVTDIVEGAVVEDVAVLENLDEGGAAMSVGPFDHIAKVLDLNVHRTGDEGGMDAEGDGDRIEGEINGADRSRLGDLADFGGRRILPFGQAVDTVVEEQEFEIDVAAEHMHQMVAADGEAIAVTGNDPYVEVGARDLQPGGEGRCAAVNRMEAVGVHVIGEAAGAADTRDKDNIFARHAEFRHHALDLGQNRVITASGAPAYFLVGDEIFA